MWKIVIFGPAYYGYVWLLWRWEVPKGWHVDVLNRIANGGLWQVDYHPYITDADLAFWVIWLGAWIPLLLVAEFLALLFRR